MRLTISDLATRLAGSVRGDGSVEVGGVSALPAAAPGSVTFADSAAHLATALASDAAAVITQEALADGASAGKPLILVKKPRAAFARALAIFHPPRTYAAGVHPAAVVGAAAVLGEGVHVGPCAVIRDGARVGARTAIDAGAVVGEGAVVGSDCVIHPRVVLYPGVVLGDRVVVHAGTVIGADGFGYVFDEGRQQKIPQVGNVVIGDDVEIGANAAIDRATIGSTVIGRGTKLDNLVQIGHNDVVGEHCVIAAQAGIAGSATLGSYLMVGGQVGVGDHVTLGDRSMIGAQSGVIGDLPAGSVVWGTPAIPKGDRLRQLAALGRLPELLKSLAKRNS